MVSVKKGLCCLSMVVFGFGVYRYHKKSKQSHAPSISMSACDRYYQQWMKQREAMAVIMSEMPKDKEPIVTMMQSDIEHYPKIEQNVTALAS